MPVYSNRIWIFDVEHGAMVFVRSSAGPTLVLDCGKAQFFSPTRYICANELTDAERNSAYPITQLVVSHPHDDHIEDIDEFTKRLKPQITYRQQYDWTDVKAQSGGDYLNLDRWSSFQAAYNQPVPQVYWGPVQFSHKYLSVAQAQSLNQSKYINNSSIVTVVQIGSFKLTFPGDLEADGWEALLNWEVFREAISGTSVFVTSHHGHSSGYTPRIFEAMGRPWFNISSIHHGDMNIAAEYSLEQSAKGVKWNGVDRRSFTTRKDGSCLISVSDTGEWTYAFWELAQNLVPLTRRA